MKISAISLLVASVSVLLAGCGGGGSSTDSATTATSVPVMTPVPAVTDPGTTPATNPTGASGPVVPVESAIAALYTTSRHFGRTETASGTADVYTFSRDFTVGTAATIENTAASSVDITGSVIKNGVQLTSSAQTDYFLTAPYRLIARKFSGNPLYLVASNQQPLPATGKSGDTGKFYDAVTYDSSAKVNVVSTSAQTWAITPDTDTSVTFCVNSTTSIPQLAGTSTKSDCYKIGTNGIVSSVAFVLPN